MAIINDNCHFLPLSLKDGWGSVIFHRKYQLKMFDGTDPWSMLKVGSHITEDDTREGANIGSSFLTGHFGSFPRRCLRNVLSAKCHVNVLSLHRKWPK